MNEIDITRLDIDQLTELHDKVQGELASRERQKRVELRAHVERRLAAEGYTLNGIFPDLVAAASAGTRRKRTAKYRDPQSPDNSWSGIGPTPKWVKAILEERGIVSQRSSPSRCTGSTARSPHISRSRGVWC